MPLRTRQHCVSKCRGEKEKGAERERERCAEREREGQRERERRIDMQRDAERERAGEKFHDHVGCTDQSPDCTTLEPKRADQPERTTKVKLNKVFFPK